MVKFGVANAKMLILRSCRGAKRIKVNNYSSFPTASEYENDHHGRNQESRNSIKEGKTESAPCWVPHPRTGIYVPKGHEWVMDDVPESAASFNHTYWLRNVDGVERPDPDIPSDHYVSTIF